MMVFLKFFTQFIIAFIIVRLMGGDKLSFAIVLVAQCLFELISIEDKIKE